MTTGQVKLFNRHGGYGVIQADERGDVVFFRAQSCSVSPRVGDRVAFGVRLESKKRAAGGGRNKAASRVLPMKSWFFKYPLAGIRLKSPTPVVSQMAAQSSTAAIELL
jgi:cold shock CspA family protein